MSVLGIDRKLRRSFNKLKSYAEDRDQPTNERSEEKEMDSGIYLQTFLHHWDSCHQTFLLFEPQSSQVQDDVINVSAQLEQMIELLKYEGSMCSTKSILDYILSENVLGELTGWIKSLPSNLIGGLINLQIYLFEFLISDKDRGGSLLTHQTVLRPLIAVLELCETTTALFSEEDLLGLIHSLSILVMENPDFIELFLSSSSTKKLILFSLLTPYLHKPGNVGQRAKESILIFISLTSKHKIVEYVIVESNFCLILAAGLSALFSALPSNLDADPQSWHKLDMSDCQTIPELNCLMSSLELCSAVVEVSPASISTQLLQLILTGFLNPICAPALASDTQSEVIAYTTYLNLFLTHITAQPLVVLIIRFLFTGTVEGRLIKDILISRIDSSSQVGTVTLALCETILSYNIEDVMFSLVFQHLISGHFLQPAHREKLRKTDPQCRAALKLLSLAPVSCDPPSTPLAPRRDIFSPPASTWTTPANPGSSELLDSPRLTDSYQTYLSDTRLLVGRTVMDCLHWRNRYDGSDQYNQSSKTKAVKTTSLGSRIEKRGFIIEKPVTEIGDFGDGLNGPSSMSGESSGYLSGSFDPEPEEVTLSPEEEREFWTAVGGSDVTKARLRSVLARIQHEDRLSLSSIGEEKDAAACGAQEEGQLALEADLHPEDDLPGPSLGPFLSALLDKVQSFDRNTLNFNLRLTAVISKLATYPQPLLRSVLTLPDIVTEHPCLTLIQAIGVVRSRVDSIMPGLLGAEEAIRQGRLFLHSRINAERGGSTTSITSLPSTLGEYSRRGSMLLNLLGRRTGSISSAPHRSPTFIPPHTHRMAMSAILLEEWLHELAAIAQAHSALDQQAAIWR